MTMNICQTLSLSEHLCLQYQDEDENSNLRGMDFSRAEGRTLQLILLTEHLRCRLHAERNEPQMIKDRRYHLKIYPCCFVGRELVDWLIKRGEATSRNTAIQCICVLQNHGFLHHVCDDHMFKDEMLFYRFRRDDATLTPTPQEDLVFKCWDIYYRLQVEGNDVVKLQQCGDCVWRKCFCGCDLVSWLMENRDVQDRLTAVALCREFQQMGLIKHVMDEDDFDDKEHHYQFNLDKIISRKLMDYLLIRDDKMHSTPPGSPGNIRRRNVSPLTISIPTAGSASNPVSFSHSNVSQETKTSSPNSPDGFPYSSSPGSLSPRPVIVHEVTVEELLDPNGPYVMKNIKIMCDAVGFGFVVRGTAPVYVQTVDPKGPAAMAGLKVRMFVRCVNGKDVLHWTHKEVQQEILRGQNVVDLVLMSHFKGGS